MTHAPSTATRQCVYQDNWGLCLVWGAGTLGDWGLLRVVPFLGAPRGGAFCLPRQFPPLLPACDFRSALAVVDITPYGARRTCGDGARCKAGGREGPRWMHRAAPPRRAVPGDPTETEASCQTTKRPAGGRGAPVGGVSSSGFTSASRGPPGRTMSGSEPHEEN